MRARAAAWRSAPTPAIFRVIAPGAALMASMLFSTSLPPTISMPMFVAALEPCSTRLPRLTGSGKNASTALSYSWPAPSDANAAAAGTVTSSSGVATCGPN